MISRRRRVSRGDFAHLRANSAFRTISGDWFSVRIYSSPPKQEGKISIIVSSKVAVGVNRNKIRRMLYDMLGAINLNQKTMLFYVRTMPPPQNEINLIIPKLSQELCK